MQAFTLHVDSQREELITRIGARARPVHGNAGVGRPHFDTSVGARHQTV